MCMWDSVPATIDEIVNKLELHLSVFTLLIAVPSGSCPQETELIGEL